MINVVAAIIHKDNKILIAKKKEGKSLAGYWEFPGGKIEPGETAEESLVRELQEEMKINIKIINYIGKSIYDYGHIKIALNGFLVEIQNGEIILTDHDDYQWVTLQEIGNFKLAPADIPLIKMIKERDFRIL